MELKINEPCHEDWDKMKIGMYSRHCESCEKSVIDFTQMNRGEIITYLLMNPNESVCGRMHRSQMDFRHEDVPLILEAIQKHRPSNAFMILALVALTLASCGQPNGKVAASNTVKTELIQEDSTVTPSKDTSSQTCHDKAVPVKKAVAGIISEPVEPPYPLLGMVVVDPIDVGDIEVPMPPPPPIQNDEPRDFVEVMPEFPGGVEAMMGFINKNIQYPQVAKEEGIEGTVYLRILVEKDGTLSRISVVRGVSGAPSLDAEAKRITELMPKWTPGTEGGKAYRVNMHLPIRFRLVD